MKLLLRRIAGMFTTAGLVTFCDTCAQACDHACRQTARERDLTLTMFRSR